MRKSVVYLTHYCGDKLPSWYIGSTFEDRVLNGYNGSASSEKYIKIYKQEQKENKHLFRTRVLSYHNTREEALTEEIRLQQMHNVVKSEKYYNESLASVNGMFGRDVSGKNNPNYGKKASDVTRELQSAAAQNRDDIVCPHCGVTGKTHNLMQKWHFNNCKLLNQRVLYECKYCDVVSENKTNMKLHHNDNCRHNTNKTKELIVCNYCGKQSYSIMNMKRWHFDKCRRKDDINKKVINEII